MFNKFYNSNRRHARVIQVSGHVSNIEVGSRSSAHMRRRRPIQCYLTLGELVGELVQHIKGAQRHNCGGWLGSILWWAQK